MRFTYVAYTLLEPGTAVKLIDDLCIANTNHNKAAAFDRCLTWTLSYGSFVDYFAKPLQWLRAAYSFGRRQ